MGNSHRHAHVKVPVILLGGLDGKFKGNRHIVFPDNTERTSNMLLALLHKYDIEEFPKYDAGGRQVGVSRKLRFQHHAPIVMKGTAPAVIWTAAALLLLATPVAAQIGGRPQRPKVQRPDGPVWEVIRKHCTACHGIDDFAFYAQDRAAWQKLIAQKHKPGEADLSDADRDLLLDWLARNSARTRSHFREPTFLLRSRLSFPIRKPSGFSIGRAHNVMRWTRCKRRGRPRRPGGSRFWI